MSTLRWAGGPIQSRVSTGGCCGAAMAVVLATAGTASAQTEFHYQFGHLVNPFASPATTARTQILTLQQASTWKGGDSFFFVDIIDDAGIDGFNDKDLYSEWYPTLSFSKVSGSTVGAGPIRDVALIGGINIDGDANFLKFLPGVRLSWSVPGFVFLNTDMTAFFDASTGFASGGAAQTSQSYMFDVNWLSIFSIGNQSFNFMGHAEYIGATTIREDVPFNRNLNGWILAQPQFVWDLGNAIGGEPAANQFFIGVEYQYWRNKLGAEADENTVQFLAVWRM